MQLKFGHCKLLPPQLLPATGMGPGIWSRAVSYGEEQVEAGATGAGGVKLEFELCLHLPAHLPFHAKNLKQTLSWYPFIKLI